MEEQKEPRREEYRLSGSAKNLKDKIREILHEGNVRRIVVKNDKGRTLLDVPLTAGVVGAALLPFMAALGGLFAIASEWTIEVERDAT